MTVAILTDIGGLDHVVEDLQETVIAPLKFPQLFASSAAGLYAAPKGFYTS